MSKSKYTDRICCIIIAVSLALSVIFCCGKSLGIETAAKVIGYENRLFDTSCVHTIDIVMDDWEGFIDGCEDEEYVVCAAVIDGEAFRNVGIRAKGNTSLSSVSAYGNDRYSFKIEFDHYDSTKTYHGLDKLSLNNIIQDNTYMKDYLVYQMMNYMGAAAPLCSFAYITVNGEDWGLYLAVEAVEDSFSERCFGSSGNLYKPDSMSMGGGKGNGGGFDPTEWENTADVTAENGDTAQTSGKTRREFGAKGENGGMNGGSARGSSDVMLVYTDDDYDSYSNIFDNAKTDITNADKDRLIASLKTLNEGTDIESVVDIDEVIRYFVVHNFVCNFDSYTGSMIHNYYLYESSGVLSMIPWDYNLAFGSFGGAGSSSDATSMVNFPIDSPVSGGTTESRPMVAWIFANEEYTALYHEIMQEFITEYFDSGYFAEMIESTAEMIAPYVEKDPTKFCTYEEFTKGAEALEQFCLLRAESVSGQLDGTIPSTSDGQAADNSALVDGSGVDLSSAGSMGGGKGGFGGGNKGGFADFNGNMPKQFSAGSAGEENSSESSVQTPPEMPEMSASDNFSDSFEKGTFPNGGGNFTPPDGMYEQGEMPGFPNDSDKSAAPEISGGSSDTETDSGTSDSDNSTQPDTGASEFIGGFPQGGGFAPDGNQAPVNAPQNTQNIGNSLILLGVSLAVLAAGIIFAVLFKNK
ncbi:MAG: CotH kinase family protein [Oscillospiraceae bacterium]